MKDLLPTAEDIEFYKNHGYYISKKIISESIINEALFGIEQYYNCGYNNIHDWSIPEIIPTIHQTYKDRTKFREDSYCAFHNDKIMALIKTKIISKIAAILMESDVTRYWKDQLNYKPTKNEKSKGTVGFHRDKVYWSNCSSNKMITAWIPLHDCDEHNGGLVFLKNSKDWFNNFHLKTFDDQDMNKVKSLINSDGDDIIEVPISLEKGQVSFHNCMTIHGSYENLSKDPRQAIALHLQNGKNRYVNFGFDKKQQRVLHTNDIISRKDSKGNPDYSDPNIFIELYNRENDVE